jgi:endonuclease/exonuclease/phosphatase family metal-dependent hydrolase
MIVRVATFNIRKGRAFDRLNSWPVRRRATAATIAALGADILGLQEVFEFQRRYLVRRLPELRWFGQGRSGGRAGESCPIAVSGPPISVRDERTRWYGPAPATPGSRLPGASFPRIATLIRCRHEPSGTEFEVANTHLDERLGENRSASVRQLLDWLDRAVPTVVIGDFNCVPGDAPVLGPLTDAGFQLAPVTGGTSHGFTGRADGARIDHIFLSPHWTIEDATVIRERPGRRLPSDHWPVRATVRLDQAGAATGTS